MQTDNKTTFFSIITTTYNRAYILQKVFDSLMSQKYKNFEWIVGDDGSDDNTEEIIKTFQEKAAFAIRYYKFSHRGKTATFDAIYNLSNGEYIFSVDSDDELHCADTLQTMYEKIQQLDSNENFWGVCGCHVDQNGNVFPKLDCDYFDITKENFFDLWADGSYLLNNKWIHKRIKNGFKTFKHPEVKEFLPYYPEIVDFMRNVFESEDFRYRLFNEKIYTYTIYREDCVSLMTPAYPLRWYETTGIINLFYKYNMVQKYQTKIDSKMQMLAKNIYKEKGFVYTIKNLYNIKAKTDFIKAYFIVRKFNNIQQLFSVRNEYSKNNEKHKVITILGIKIKLKTAKTRTAVRESNPPSC